MTSVFVAAWAGLPLSATLTPTRDVPGLVAVPLITPAPERFSPAGKDPVRIDHVYGAVPPVAANVWEYDAPGPATGKTGGVVIERGRIMVIESGWDAVCDAASEASTVKLNIPDVVGVPVMTPGPDNVRPGGNVP